MNIADIEYAVNAPDRTSFSWIVAHIVGAILLAWIAVINGFPMVFSDSGGYLRVGTELFYLMDRPVFYGLLMAPFARIFGLWGIVVFQALATSWLIGEVFFAVTRRRSSILLLMVFAALAGLSSLPWFVGQVMPDLATSLLALTLYLVVFAARRGWRIWLLPAVLTGEITLHLSHIPIAAALIGLAAAVLVCQVGWRLALRRVAPAIAALVIAVLGLCTVNLIAANTFRPSLESEKFLVAKTFDSHLGQPVLDRVCLTETSTLCKARAFVEDPRRPLPGQDYLWAADSPRVAIDHQDSAALRAEEGAFSKRVFREDPTGAVRVAAISWRDQMVQAHAADGMIRYVVGTQVVRQIRKYFTRDSSAFDSSLQQRGALQQLAMVPDRAIALLVALTTPFILWSAIRRRDRRMVGFVSLMLGTIIVNAAVCGILSGPADRYQSRVLWLILLIGLIALAQRITALAKQRLHPVAGRSPHPLRRLATDQ